MNINDYRGENAIDFLADVIEPASKIFSNEEIRNALSSEEKNLGAVAKRIFKEYKTETLEILARMDGVEPKEYDKSPIYIIAQLLSLLNSAMVDVTAVFFSAAQTEGNPSFGAPTENTQESEK